MSEISTEEKMRNRNWIPGLIVFCCFLVAIFFFQAIRVGKENYKEFEQSLTVGELLYIQEMAYIVAGTSKGDLIVYKSGKIEMIAKTVVHYEGDPKPVYIWYNWTEMDNVSPLKQCFDKKRLLEIDRVIFKNNPGWAHYAQKFFGFNGIN